MLVDLSSLSTPWDALASVHLRFRDDMEIGIVELSDQQWAHALSRLPRLESIRMEVEHYVELEFVRQFLSQLHHMRPSLRDVAVVVLPHAFSFGFDEYPALVLWPGIIRYQMEINDVLRVELLVEQEPECHRFIDLCKDASESCNEFRLLAQQSSRFGWNIVTIDS
jgi:hypothetical protein